MNSTNGALAEVLTVQHCELTESADVQPWLDAKEFRSSLDAHHSVADSTSSGKRPDSATEDQQLGNRPMVLGTGARPSTGRSAIGRPSLVPADMFAPPPSAPADQVPNAQSSMSASWPKRPTR